MADPLASCVVRIQTRDGTIVGAGFCVSDRHVLTCAHVVIQALGLPEDSPGPIEGDVRLDFPLLAPRQSLAGRVVRWEPLATNTASGGAEGDIAVLELVGDPPEGARPAPLVSAGDFWGHS